MKNIIKKPIIISLGGSLLVPEMIDVVFIKRFARLIRALVAKGYRFVLITGGGRTARNYQIAAGKICELHDEDLDWLGVHATRINAHLVRTIFHDLSHPRIIKRPKEPLSWKEPILVAAGWKPGFSTDYDAVLLADQVGADTIINLSNIDYVYSSDPKADSGAKPLKSISWSAYRQLIPTAWKPGLSSPFDPIASKTAQKAGLNVKVVGGSDLSNLRHAIVGTAFRGTLIAD
jgi:uridylate kinase